MHRAGHLGAALLCGVPGLVVLSLLEFPLAIGLWVCCLIGTSSLPDIDQRLPIPHRGPTHSLAFIVPASLILGAVATGIVLMFGQWEMAQVLVNSERAFRLSPFVVGGTAVVGCFVGLASHLLSDALTVGRGRYAIQPLWPVSDRSLRFGLTKADSLMWNYGLLCLGTVATAIVIGAPV